MCCLFIPWSLFATESHVSGYMIKWRNRNKMKISLSNFNALASFLLLILNENFSYLILPRYIFNTILKSLTSRLFCWCLTHYVALHCSVSSLVFFWFPGSHSRVNQCPVNEHGCLDLDVCIHMSKLCDGVPDCSDGWDEGPHCRGDKHKTHSERIV